MTGFLCDSQVLIWALDSPRKLSSKARRAISNPQNQVWVSAVSAYELSLKHRLGRLPGAEPLITSFSRQLGYLRATELAIDSTHAIEAGRMEWEHRDPFDRILVAQAMIEGLTLITADEAIREFAPLNTLW